MPVLTFDDELKMTPGGVPVGPNGIPRVVVTKSGEGALTFDEFTPESTGAKVGRYAKDIGQSVISGLDKGVAGLAGLPADAALGINAAVNYGKSKVQGRPFEEVEAESDRNAVISRDAVRAYGSQAAHAGSPLKHTPTTTAGKYAQSGAEFVPAAILGPGNMARNAVALGVAPGLASEAAGQATEGGAYEPYARAGTAVLAGAAGQWATAPNAAGVAISKAARGATPAQVDEAERLFEYAQGIGAPLTRAEALQHVTGGATQLGNLQRVVEGSGEMRPFMAARPGQVEDAARAQFGRLGPVSQDPHGIGPAVGATAERTVKDVEGARSRATAPFYRSAASDNVPSSEMQQFVGQLDAAIASDKTGIVGGQLQELRSLLVDRPATPGVPAVPAQRTASPTPNGQIFTTVPGKPAKPGTPETYLTDIENLDRARKYLRDKVGMPQIGAEAITKEQGAAILGQLDALRQRMIAASPDFAAGKDIHQVITEKIVTPLMNGPIGKLAQKDLPTKKAISVLFPENPLPGSEAAIGQAVAEVARRRPGAARELVRAHVESVFNEATQRLQSGANEFGGAGFAAMLRGNPQQAANLEAAITALRGGQTYQGFNRFLDVLEAQGSRQRIGSQTAFNQEVQAGLKTGGTVAEALSSLASVGTKLPSKINTRIEQWRMGGNVREIADILTNPAAAQLFRQLATTPANSAKAGAIVARLAYLADRSREN